MFNGCVGVKPSVGRLSTRGVVPACKSLDCVTVFAHSVADAAALTKLMEVRMKSRESIDHTGLSMCPHVIFGGSSLVGGS